MGLADALISKLAKTIADNLDAAVSSRLASADSRLNVLDASIASRLASADGRLDRLDAGVSSRLSNTDVRLNVLDATISSRIATADPRISGFGIPKLPVQSGYTGKSITGLTNPGYFCFKSQTIAANGEFGLKVIRSNDATNQWVTLVDVTGSGWLFGVLLANISTGSNSLSLQVIVDGVTVISVASQQIGSSSTQLYIGAVDAYYNGSLLALVTTPNFAVPMLYGTSLQIKYKGNYASAWLSAIYV